ncbi:pyridoxamine 5'-phosphate oxidase family protein [Natronocalculus amylovorans]|uniref:Pyridoxamine 5'-phosphate oxidase family protein n=1 Tax=Natronocalculus amylovorans TaxID=2917812 RepID=A0AAE3FZ45_9EURY|nr:pyridoxamine 5'-phosphate oxidase family protein [Natronocalculus amylovorans]MCL9818017.1 pyridoxamine 5'-phosphate oxidase family protein [Natronocalculus amylovorans]
MSDHRETDMSASDIDDFLSRHETGVLSLARDDSPYAIPISYGYDSTNQVLFMRLVSTPESEKRAFLSSTPDARVVVYEEGDETYASVVANGLLERIELSELTPETIEQYGETRRPLFEIWAQGKADLDIELYKLVPETLSGRTVTIDRDSA